jgi:hypothetical protein
MALTASSGDSGITCQLTYGGKDALKMAAVNVSNKIVDLIKLSAVK